MCHSILGARAQQSHRCAVMELVVWCVRWYFGNRKIQILRILATSEPLEGRINGTPNFNKLVSITRLIDQVSHSKQY